MLLTKFNMKNTSGTALKIIMKRLKNLPYGDNSQEVQKIMEKYKNELAEMNTTRPIIPFKKLTSDAHLPSKGSAGAAGWDLYASLGEDDFLAIGGQGSYLVSTGVAVALPVGYVGLIFARSGLATKQGLRPSNCVGVIDSDYRGEIMVSLYNDTQQIQKIKNGERIAQLVVVPFLSFDIEEVDELDETERGTGGFGSTGRT